MEISFAILGMGLLCLVIGAVLGYITRQSIAKKQLNTAEGKASNLIEEAEKKSQELILESKNKAVTILEEAKKKEAESKIETN